MWIDVTVLRFPGETLSTKLYDVMSYHISPINLNNNSFIRVIYFRSANAYITSH